jgi:signal transduction histidine kinase/ligand-binding sensor domain-containing protein
MMPSPRGGGQRVVGIARSVYDEVMRSNSSPRLALAVAAVVMTATVAGAQTLAIRHYDVADGLPNSRVTCIHQDARNFVWFGTWEGLCRFDGLEIVTFGVNDGIDNPLITAIAEDASGHLWIGTHSGGIARSRDDLVAGPGRAAQRAKLFTSYRIGDAPDANDVDAIAFDARGDLWCGTAAGIARARITGGVPGPFELVADRGVNVPHAAIHDTRGHIWLAAQRRLLEIDGGSDTRGSIVEHAFRAGPEAGELATLALRGDGSIVVAFERAAYAISARDGAWTELPVALEPDQTIRAIYPEADGRVWLGTTRGLVSWRDGVQRTYTTGNGLSDASVHALCADRDHNLWMGTWSGGACRLSTEAITSFTLANGLPARDALRLVETRSGSIVCSTGQGLAEIEGETIEVVRGSREPPFDRVAHRVMQDARGDWWLGTDVGLFRARGPRLTLDSLEHFKARDGISEAPVFGMIHDDAAGRIWISSQDGSLYCFDPHRGDAPPFERVSTGTDTGHEVPRETLVDAAGTLWLAPYSELARRIDGKIVPVEPLGELATHEVRCFHQSPSGALWIGTRFHGASVTDEPEAAHPRFRNWTTRDGLASDAVWSITEDARGRIYFGTARGIDRLEPKSGRVHHITALDGLAGDIVYHCITDRRGFIWVGTSNGVSRIDPTHDDPEPALPRVHIERVQVAGNDVAVPALGGDDVAGGAFAASDDNVRIDFVAPCFRGERDLRYQYRLEGADSAWSDPTPQRSVNYAQIAPGDYRFMVRALHASGATSARPATFSFRISPPYWRTWWFLSLAILVLAAAALSMHRLRVRQVVALETIRRQIATDIHDDMGAGLSQIAILSEVAKREVAAPSRAHLDEVASLARSLRDSMSDIVWAVDPRRDRASDLVQRMRQVAFNLFEAEGVKVELNAPPQAAIESVGLAPDRRRHLLMMFKEAVSNVARHARAREVRIDVALSESKLELSIRDDGVGFDPRADSAGHGLSSLRQRAAALHASLVVDSAPGRGTRIAISMPL